MTMTKLEKQAFEAERQAAITELRRLFEAANYTAYTALEHVSASGQSRTIKAFVIIDNEPWGISHLIAKLGQFKRTPMHSQRDGVIVRGSGMDMGFHLIYSTSAMVFKNAIPNRAAWHEKEESDAGYVVKNRWL